MFYSHEILTSRQYGVATIWLVATIGNQSGTRKVTRKAIQEVDVQRACGKILEPGAPIALRLQGNLLYGVSRVHNQQCTYLVADAKKIQDQMKLFFNAFSGNQLDPEAGKTKRENILIENDPAFDPKMPLPKYELETIVTSQIYSQKTSSQMSPQSSHLSVSQSPGQGFVIQLDIDHSSSSGHHESPFGLEGLSSAQKPDDERLILHQDDEDVFGRQGDWGLEIDENGNVIESVEPPVADEEPQLPPLPHIQGEDNMSANAAQFDEQPVFDDQGDVVMQENLFPEAEPFPEPRVHAPWQNDEQPARQAPARRKKMFHIDDETQISRNVLRDWQSHYLEHCTGRARGFVSATRAKRNAMLLTFGLGIGNIGQSVGVPGLIHPLAIEFSGDALFTTVTGINVEDFRGRRRSASEAIEDDEQEEERRVRPRLMKREEEKEQARAAQEDDFMNLDDPFADGVPQEVGREAEHPMSDHLSSTLLPWNRGSSAVPGSSARAPNPAQQGRDLSSPLGKRGDPQDIVRYSDDAPMGDFGSDGNFGGGFGSADSSFDGMQAPDLVPEGYKPGVAPTAQEIQAQNDRLFEQLDREGYNFMSFTQDAVNKDGERRRDEDFDMNRKWLAFDDLFMPRVTPRSTAAQAFYHTLCLVTKGKMYVEQDDTEQKPFGAIWIGVEAMVSSV
ncbi:Rec8 like protein-domain-containing protein [Xylaria cf. heliscus]|nr:Rec8 like protein-domain-containing protein [Xylaria cf. heliscus]